MRLRDIVKRVLTGGAPDKDRKDAGYIVMHPIKSDKKITQLDDGPQKKKRNKKRAKMAKASRKINRRK